MKTLHFINSFGQTTETLVQNYYRKSISCGDVQLFAFKNYSDGELKFYRQSITVKKRLKDF